MGWVKKIHNCPTPTAEDVKVAQAQVGSIWECDSQPPGSSEVCGDQWLLQQIKGEGRGVVGEYPKWQRLTIHRQPIRGPGTASSAEQSDPATPDSDAPDQDATRGRTRTFHPIPPASPYFQ